MSDDYRREQLGEHDWDSGVDSVGSWEDAVRGSEDVKIAAEWWMRLVHDELSEEQYAELMDLLELYPALWRDCALAFLEDQALKKALTDWAASSSTGQLDAVRMALDETSAALEHSRGQTAATSVVQGRSGQFLAHGERSANGELVSNGLQTDRSELNGDPGRVRLARWNSTRWVTLAALLLIGFTIGKWADLNGMLGANVDMWTNWTGQAPETQGWLAGGDVASVGGKSGHTGVAETGEMVVGLLSDLPTESRDRLLLLADRRKIEATVPVSTPVAWESGKVEATRKFVFVRSKCGRAIVIPVDDYVCSADDFQ